MKPDWAILKPAPVEVIESLGFPPLQAQLLYNRGTVLQIGGALISIPKQF